MRRMGILLAGLLSVTFGHFAVAEVLAAGMPWQQPLLKSTVLSLESQSLEPGTTYGVNVGLMTGALADGEQVAVTLTIPGHDAIVKTLHAGDPSFYIPFRTNVGGSASLSLTRNETGPDRPIEAHAQWSVLGDAAVANRFEAEPNNAPAQANSLVIGNAVYGSADDVEYLDNADESKNGLDWFQFELTDEVPRLVMFELDIPDRDVSVNMRVYTLDESGKPVPYLNGKDPMEIVHDRERERYSKSITRNFSKGVYYLEVNANHPRYILKSTVYPIPPYDDPSLAVEVGSRYVMDVGDAWFAQIPREGNIYRRAQNMHETAMRCTACHPAVFSTEAVLTAHRNGYPIQSKANFRYVVERIYNSMTPFYGPDGLYWQRFIAIPLQSQGKQGAVLTDFEREVSGRETDIVPRFGPLLRSAWIDRTVLPDDEQNGVVPADSKFGFAWRDWKMLKECYRRTGDKTYLDAAVNLEHLFTDDAAKEKMATFQDTVHLFLGLYYMGPVAYKDRIEALRDQIMLAQNDDGSWHEEGKAGSPGAVYTTGQVLWTLMETGMRPETDPRLEKGLRWLLTKQQIFGGWFQTDSHENFRTPMRETRYALMALSAGYPRPSGPLKGIGNPNGGPAIAPAVDATPVDALDALENIWEVPADQVTTVAAAIHPLLARPEPPVRAAAAAALGRIAGAESVEPLLPLLRDPSKLAWREGAWALRQLGNQGHSVNTLLAALRDSDPLVRRSASRAFAYQFQGMDGRMDIAHTFVRLASDPDLLTRLQALRTLRQWFYRSDDPTFKLTVIQTVIDRMGVPETPVMRTNLAQNMYILLDENQSGGVSMQRNLRDVPDQVRENVLNGRKKIEETVLLQPVLKAMAAGNELQREALLESFDGSFFKGRFYARVPRDMIDVGNDREFSFMYTPDQSFLEATLGKLIESEPRNAQLRRGIQLASFFEMPSQSASATLQLLLLSAMFSNSPELQDTAREVVRKDLVLRAQEDERIAAKVSEIMSSADIPAQGAILAALTRSPDSLALPQVQDTVRAFADRSLEDESASMALVPLVNTSILDDTQALAVLEKSWKGLRGRPAAERIPMIEALAKRTTLIGNTPDAVTAPRPQQDLQRRALRILEDASTDPDVALREKLFALLPDLTELRRQARVATLLYAGLSDESPAIRIKSLKLAEENNDVWNEEDVHEYVMKNLIAADPKVRKAALDTVVNRKLLSSEPRYAARVKSVIDGDTELADSATNALREANVDPAQIKADASIAAVQAPDLLYFRDHVNNYLYLKGADQNACADCHATHTILGLAEPHQDGSPLTDSEIVMNYRSLLKVVNTVDPEQSLILRKPRSPFGTGAATTESPTGVTHVGGVRWGDETADPAYQAILAFIRTASTSQQTKPANSLADSYSPEYPPAFAIDANPSTIWHTEFVGAMPGYPHELVLDLGSVRTIHGATYLPRQESDNGRVAEYEIYVSADNQNWGEPIAKGVWPNDASPKTFFVAPTAARYIKLRGLSEVKGQPFMSAAEFEALVESATTLAKE